MGQIAQDGNLHDETTLYLEWICKLAFALLLLLGTGCDDSARTKEDKKKEKERKTKELKKWDSWRNQSRMKLSTIWGA